jgi:hypothetical protein
MISREVVRHVDNFDRAQALTTTPAGDFGWTIKDTSAAGTPTYLCLTEDGGALKVLFDNTNENQIVTVYQNDVLPYDLALLQAVEFTLKVGGFDAVTTLVWGIASAQNNTEDSVTVNGWFKIDGTVSTSNVVVETDDNTKDLDDKATGQTLSTTYKKCTIDFSNGLSDVRFFIDGNRVAAGTTFDMSAVTSGQNIQLLLQMQKPSGTATPFFQVTKAAVQYKTADGA